MAQAAQSEAEWIVNELLGNMINNAADTSHPETERLAPLHEDVMSHGEEIRVLQSQIHAQTITNEALQAVNNQLQEQLCEIAKKFDKQNNTLEVYERASEGLKETVRRVQLELNRLIEAAREERVASAVVDRASKGPFITVQVAFLVVVALYAATQLESTRNIVLHPGFMVSFMASAAAVVFYAFDAFAKGKANASVRHLGRNIPTLGLIILFQQLFGPDITFMVVPTCFQAFYTWNHSVEEKKRLERIRESQKRERRQKQFEDDGSA